MNYEDAQLYCQNKFGNLVGGLFEPRLFSTNQLVYNEAVNFASGTGDDFWLGMTWLPKVSMSMPVITNKLLMECGYQVNLVHPVNDVLVI